MQKVTVKSDCFGFFHRWAYWMGGDKKEPIGAFLDFFASSVWKGRASFDVATFHKGLRAAKGRKHHVKVGEEGLQALVSWAERCGYPSAAFGFTELARLAGLAWPNIALDATEPCLTKCTEVFQDLVETAAGSRPTCIFCDGKKSGKQIWVQSTRFVGVAHLGCADALFEALEKDPELREAYDRGELDIYVRKSARIQK